MTGMNPMIVIARSSLSSHDNYDHQFATAASRGRKA